MNTSISVIVPVGLRCGAVDELYLEYKAGLAALGANIECIFVLDGPHPSVAAALKKLQQAGEPLIIIQLTRRFGESAALLAGLERSSAEIVVTLPAYPQIQAADLPRLVSTVERGEADLAIAHRTPRSGSKLEQFRRWVFHAFLGKVTKLRFHDLGCTARAMRREVLEEVRPYGEQHRFLAVQADRLGFRVREVPVRQSSKDRFKGHYQVRAYAHQFLDIFNIFFLVRFTKRPLRFFGTMGAITFGIGMALIALLIVDRFIFNEPLGSRPALLLSSLLAVLGMQLFALGLLGELIIFTHARDKKDYRIEQIVQADPATEENLPSSDDPVVSELRYSRT